MQRVERVCQAPQSFDDGHVLADDLALSQGTGKVS